MPHQHKSGTLKQSNKKHKGSAASKRELKRGLGPGKTESTRGHASLKARSTSNMALEARNKRITRDFNAKKSERMQQWLDKRIGTTSSGGIASTNGVHNSIPKIVVFVPLSPAASEINLPSSLTLDDSNIISNVNCNPDVTSSDDNGSVVYHSITFNGKTNMRCTFMQPRYDMKVVVDAVKVADIVVYIMNVPSFENQPGADATVPMAGEELQSERENCFIASGGFEIITAIKAIGTPISACCFTGLPPGGTSNANTSIGAKQRVYFHTMKQLGARMASSHLYKDVKTMEYYPQVSTASGMAVEVNNNSNTNSCGNNQLLRFIHETLVSSTDNRMVWRMNRSYLAVDSVFSAPSTAATAAESEKSVYIRGYIRNKPLCVDSLFHLVDVGTAAVVSIKAVAPGSAIGAPASCGLTTLYADVNKQDSLVMEACPDVLQGKRVHIYTYIYIYIHIYIYVE